MAPSERPPPAGRTYLAAAGLFVAIALAATRAWFVRDLLPPGDFAGYATAIRVVRDAVLRHGHVPAWCGTCLGSTAVFGGSVKDILALPLAVFLDPVLATKLAFVVGKVLGAMAMYAVFVRLFAAPPSARARTTRASTSTHRCRASSVPSC